MNFLKNLFNKKSENNEDFNNVVIAQYDQIANLVKESRIKQNLTIRELSEISKISEVTINAIENNNKSFRPKYPFIRSILFKLEECLVIKKNTLVELATRERDTVKNKKNDFLVSKFDLINTWQGSLLYFFILVLSIFVLKRYFVLNVNVIEIQNTENKSIDE